MKSFSFSSEHMPVERPPLLTEHLPHNPYELLHDIFSIESNGENLKASLIHWLRILNHDRNSSNINDNPCAALDVFYNSLNNLIDALQKIESGKGLISSLGLTTVGQTESIEEANMSLRQFCSRYPQIHTHRELWCFMHAVLENSSEMSPDFDPSLVVDWYQQVSALIDAAYLLRAE